MKIFLSFLLVALIAGGTQAQRYPFVNYTTSNGLVQSNITDIAQDKLGNIWIGTQGGISIFDGSKFTNFDDQRVLQSLNILSILCDSTGLVWIATANGLLRYDHEFKTVFQPKDTIHARTSSLVTYGNLIYFICNSNIYQIDSGQVIKKVTINGELEKNAQFICFDIHGNLWVVTDNQKVFRVSNGTIKEFLKPEFIDRVYSNSFGFIRLNSKTHGDPYFVSNFGTLYIDGDTLGWFQQKYPKFFTMGTGAGTFVYEDRDSVTWVGATRGLVKLVNLDSSVRFNKQNGFGDHSVSVITRDRENNLWVGSTYYGVYKLSNEALFNVPPVGNAEFKNIYSSATIDDRTAVVGTWGSGPFLLKDKALVPLQYVTAMQREAPGLNYITTICHVGKTSYLGCLDEGLWKLEDGSTKIYRIPLKERDAPVDNIIRYCGRFLVQAQDGSSFLYDDRFRLLKASERNMNMIRLAGETLYHMSSIGQTDIIDSNFKTTRQNVFPEVQSEITQILNYDGRIIISTIGQGVFFYDSSRKFVSRLYKGNGLNSNVVNCLLTERGKLYAGTNYGLAQVDLRSGKVRIFNENEGMFNSECRKQGLLRLSDDMISVATTSGLFLYYHGKDNTATLARGFVHISSLTASGDDKAVYPFDGQNQEIFLSQKIPYSNNEIRIDFKGVSQRAAGTLEYHYRLTGTVDSAWKTVYEDAPVEFHQLPPGDYKFTVYARVKDYVSPKAFVAFTIKKPLQGEWWFQLIVLSALAAFVLLFLNFLNRLYQKYIQTKTIDEFGRNVKRKNSQIISSLENVQRHLTDISQTHYQHHNLDSGDLNFLYANAGLTRMRELVQRENISLKDFHDYFDKVIVIPGRDEKKIYQEIFDPSLKIPMDKAFALMELFSLYLTWKLTENPQFLFSLTSEARSNNRLVIRCYPLNSLGVLLPSTLEAGFRKMLKKMKDEHWSVAFIENPGTSSMLIVEMEI
ncbi:MAG: hypothetical protein JNK79_10775 [Chitinophagaceae bacterium]|nr:hypothetical protein [Chitinophagaceae bacterium]